MRPSVSMSILTLVTGLKLPLNVNIFFLCKISEGYLFLPSGVKITALVILSFTNVKLKSLLSIFSKSGPIASTISISKLSIVRLSYNLLRIVLGFDSVKHACIKFVPMIPIVSC